MKLQNRFLNKQRKNAARSSMNRKKSKQTIRFNETQLGYLLERLAPLEYRILLEAGGASPSPNLIEAVSYSSLNMFFRSDEFRQALIEYRKTGTKPLKPVKINLQKELYYTRMRRKMELEMIEKIKKC